MHPLLRGKKTYNNKHFFHVIFSAIHNTIRSVAGWVNRESTRESFLLHSLHLYAACYYWSSSAGDGFAANSTAERLCAVLGQITVVNGLGAFIVALLLSAVQEFSTTWQRHSMCVEHA